MIWCPDCAACPRQRTVLATQSGCLWCLCGRLCVGPTESTLKFLAVWEGWLTVRGEEPPFFLGSSTGWDEVPVDGLGLDGLEEWMRVRAVMAS
jgi:hypothetical protein